MKKNAIHTIVAVTAISAVALTGCGSKNTAAPANAPAAQTQSHSQAPNLKDSAGQMLSITGDLKKQLEAGDADKAKASGEQLQKTWFSFEDHVKPDYPAQYTDIEKYLVPLNAGLKKRPLDKEVLGKYTDGLAQALKDLQSAAENHKTAKQTEDPALKAAIEQYRVYVVQQGDSLVDSTAAFVKAVKDGDLGKAKQLYGPARVYFERIEPIAEGFGDLDPRIDAREKDAEKDKWTGFHVIEKALWVNNSIKDQGEFADQLLTDVQELRDKLKSLELKPAEVISGAGELLNEAGTSKITGEEELYSHLDLVDLYANVEGSKAAYDTIKPELQKKDPALASQIDERFTVLQKTLETFRQGNSFITYDKLKPEDTKQISQEIESAAEPLSKAAKILE